MGVREHVSASHVALFTHTIDRAYESQTVKGGGVAIRRTARKRKRARSRRGETENVFCVFSEF